MKAKIIILFFMILFIVSCNNTDTPDLNNTSNDELSWSLVSEKNNELKNSYNEKDIEEVKKDAINNFSDKKEKYKMKKEIELKARKNNQN